MRGVLCLFGLLLWAGSAQALSFHFPVCAENGVNFWRVHDLARGMRLGLGNDGDKRAVASFNSNSDLPVLDLPNNHWFVLTRCEENGAELSVRFDTQAKRQEGLFVLYETIALGRPLGFEDLYKNLRTTDGTRLFASSKLRMHCICEVKKG